jgi:hypothetical protein
VHKNRKLAFTEEGSWFGHASRRIKYGPILRPAGSDSFDVIITLPQNIERCLWTRSTLVQHEAYRLNVLRTDWTETTIDLPDLPTLLVPNTAKYQSCTFVYSRVGIQANMEEPLLPRIVKGTAQERHGRLLCEYLSSERAIDRLEDGYAAVIYLARGAKVRIGSGTPCTNHIPNGDVELITG